MPMEQASSSPQHTQLARSLSWWERSIVKRSTYAIYNQVDTAMEESPFLRRHEQQQQQEQQQDNNDECDELPQDPSQEPAQALTISPKSDILLLDRSQVQAGVMLGKGSFSIVSEVIGLDLEEEEVEPATPEEEEGKHDISLEMEDSSRQLCRRLSSIMGLSPLMEDEEDQDEEPSYKHGQYAIKHLRPDLIPKSGDPEHFQAAAADLIMEAKYLAALDHPGILKLRAVAHGGAAAFQNSGGQYDGFFIVTDRLNGTLKDKILDWQCIQQEESLLECLQMAGRDHLRLQQQQQQQQQEQRDPAAACHEESKDEEDNDESCRTMESILGKTNPRRVLLERLDIALQLAKALAYLHDRRLIFRDLKPANVGLTEDNRVQLFDFGFTRQLPSCNFIQYDHPEHVSGVEDDEDVDDDQVYFMSGKGSLMYLAPEVLHNGRYNRKADCYSFAMVFYELLTLHKPFGNVMNQEVFRELICRHKVRPSLEFAEEQQIPASVQALLRHSWEHSVSQRWTMRQICDRLEEIMLELQQEPAMSFVPAQATTVTTDHSTSSGQPLCNVFQGFARDIKLGFQILMGDTKTLQQEDFQSSPLEVTLSEESGDDDGDDDSVTAVMDEIEPTCHSATTQETVVVDSVSLRIEHQGTGVTEESSRSNLASSLSSPSLRVSVFTVTPMTATEEPLEVTLEEALSMTLSSCQKENLPTQEEEEDQRVNDEQDERCPPSPPLARTTSAPVQNKTSSMEFGDLQVPCYELPVQTPPRQPFSRRQSCNGGADMTVVKLSQRQPQRRQSYHGAMYLQEENQQWMSTTPAA